MSNTESHWNVEYVIICNKIKSSSILEPELYDYLLYTKSSRYFGIESFRFVIIFFLFHHGHCADQYIFDFLILSCYNFIYSIINGLPNTSAISLTVSLFHLISPLTFLMHNLYIFLFFQPVLFPVSSSVP